MKILVVGSSGYVGSNFIDFFCEDPENRIYGISRRYNNNPKLTNNFVGDLADYSFLCHIDESFDIVINCAAKTDHFGDKAAFYRDNVQSVINLLKAFDGKAKSIVHISTEAVYLNGPLPFLDESVPLPNHNISEYGWSKRLAEIEIGKFKSNFDTRVMILRPRLIWGGTNSIVFKKLKSALTAKSFFYVDNGNYLSSATHVRNLYNAVCCVSLHGKNGDTFFISDGAPTAFRELIKKILNNKLSDRAVSLPRPVAFFICLICDLIRKITFNNIVLPLSLSTYYLTFSPVIVSVEHAKKCIGYDPIAFES